MKTYFEKKILLGFIINLILVVVLAGIFIVRIDQNRDPALDETLNWMELSLFFIVAILLIIVYSIIRTQLLAKNVSDNSLIQNKQLLQSVIDNTSNPIFIKKINGEYLLINKEYEALFKISNEEIIGKTDHDFLPKKLADLYRDSDLEVVKALRELKIEETIQAGDGPRTYIAVKFPLYDEKGRVYAIGGISTDITDRKKLEESFQSASLFFNMSPDIMVIMTNSQFVKVNPSVSKTLGFSEEELVNQPFLNFVLPDDHAITKKEFIKLEKGVAIMQFENRWMHKDGSLIWLEWSAIPDPSTGLLYAVARDISVHKENENSLVAADKFFYMAYDLMVVAKEDHLVKVNPAFTRILGRTQKDMDNRPFLQFLHPDDYQSGVDAFNKLKKGNTITHFRARSKTKDESYKWLDWTWTIDFITGIMYGAARDVTELIQNEASLKMADKFFNMAFDILTVVKEEHFIKINPTFTKILGYEQNDLDKIKFSELTHPDDKAVTEEVLTKLLTGDPIINFKYRILCKDGTYKWLHWHSSYEPSQSILYSVTRDITENVLMEEQQEKATNELYKNEEKLRIIVENISDGVIVVNAAKELIMTNEMANKILGIDIDFKFTVNLTDRFKLYHPDEKTIFPYQNLPMERALAGEETNDVDVVLWKSDTGQKKRVLISGRPLVDEDNQVIAAVVTIKDISKYKQLEEELKETEKKYRQLIGFKKPE